jgi:signal transduction histidine kinase
MATLAGGSTVLPVRIRTPSAVDVALAVAAAAALIASGVGTASAGRVTLVVVLALAAATPLVWRRQAPIATLFLVSAGLIACIAVFSPYWAAIGVAMVALYTVSVEGDRRRSLLVGAITGIAIVSAIVLLQATGNVPEGVTRLLLVLGALVVGDTVRSRGALRQAVAERAAQRQREREQAALLRLEEERLRIARELHDSVAHALVGINVRAGVAAHLDPDRGGAAALTEIQHASAQALNELRATLDLLREPGAEAPVRPAQDLSALAELFAQAQANGLDAQLELDANGAMITSSIAQAAYRIVQESLTNVLRHAHATKAHARIRVLDGCLEIDVSDNGRGGSRGDGGHGLTGMAERAHALGGRIAAGPAANGGWHVTASLPLAGKR